jgi:coproporphyrinogen III oxidase
MTPLRTAQLNNDTVDATSWEVRKHRAAQWFRELREQIIAEFEALESEYSSTPGQFSRTPWDKRDQETGDGNLHGGGEMGLIKGALFEKAGVNVSEVYGTFTSHFAGEIPGAQSNDNRFWASGISLVTHPYNPYVPPVHMNTRMIVTASGWFGGGADLNPIFVNDQDTRDFHTALQACCDRHGADYYQRFSQWADDYFYNHHRGEHRGVGGIFYDDLATGDWEADFAFTQDIGQTFLEIYPKLVRRHMHDHWTDTDREEQLIRRGRYAEFNLVYDRGTRFGLQTGGNAEAILMSLPPMAKWP